MKKLFNPKRLLKARNSSGFTLIEVIISCALLGILVVGVMTFASPIFNMIKVNQKSARATMLAEALDVYISGSIRNAVCVEVIANTSYQTLRVSGVPGASLDESTPLGRLTKFMADNNSNNAYEVRALGINWLEDTISHRKKLMLTTLKVDNATQWNMSRLKLTTSDLDAAKVFDDSLYLNLFPVVTLSTFEKTDGSGENADGYRIVSSIYTNMECYNSGNAAARDGAGIAFEGSAYSQCFNMSGGANDIIEASSLETAIGAGVGANGYLENGTTYYYPDTFIYYIVEK